MALLQIRKLSKVYRRDSQAIPVFENIDLDIDTGEFLVLMGPSGSGKTTLLNLIAGLDEPTTGSITVGGEEVTAMSRRQLAAWRSNHVGFIFQLYNLLPVLTAYQNVELPLLLTHLSKKERREHVMTALEVVGLSDRADHFPRQLSGGQEQRVGIGRAIVAHPQLVVADEPTGDLDPDTSAEILRLLKRLNQELAVTLLMVTHDPAAAAMADRQLRLNHGKLVERLAAEETEGRLE